MNKLIIALMIVALGFVGCSKAAEASGKRHTKTTTAVEQVNDHNVAGVKVDAPNLVKVTKNTTIGVEAGKDLATDIGYNDFDWNEADKGYFGYVKVTWVGNLFDFTKKDETVVE